MGYNKQLVLWKKVFVYLIYVVMGLDYLITNKRIEKEEIDALVLVTQSPDHFMPPTSNIIQGKLGLKKDMICLDINQGCAGFIIGLIQSFMFA